MVCGEYIVGVKNRTEATVFEIKGDVHKSVSIACQQGNKTLYLKTHKINEATYIHATEDNGRGFEKFRIESGLSEGLIKFGKHLFLFKKIL